MVSLGEFRRGINGAGAGEGHIRKDTVASSLKLRDRPADLTKVTELVSEGTKICPGD